MKFKKAWIYYSNGAVTLPSFTNVIATLKEANEIMFKRCKDSNFNSECMKAPAKILYTIEPDK